MAIDPAGCVKNGVAIDGALPDEMRRGGTFQWPPIATDYAWEGLQGAMLQADLLSRGRLSGVEHGRTGPAPGRQLPVRQGALVGRGRRRVAALARRRPLRDDVSRGGPGQPGKNYGWTDWLWGS